MSDRNPGLSIDPLFVGATRPPMRWGVTYAAMLFNLIFTLELFLVTKNLLTLLSCAPIHGVCALLCARDARYFDLLLLWGRTRLPALMGNLRFWKASSYSPLEINLPSRLGTRPRHVISICIATPRTAAGPVHGIDRMAVPPC
jgi:type IV secretion system protein VirB3